MYHYAQINTAGVCVAQSILHSPVELDDMVPIDSVQNEYLGRIWNGEIWINPPPLPSIHVVSIDAGAHSEQTTTDAEFSECTTVVGAVLNITAELRQNGHTLPIDQVFRMPIISTDGRERVVLASMTQGVITMRVQMTESRVWRVTQDTINRALPEHLHMGFAGLTVYAVEPD